LRLVKVPRNRFIESVSKNSIFIYLLDPLFAYILLSELFGFDSFQPFTLPQFYLYQAIRVGVLFVLLPFSVRGLKRIRAKYRGRCPPKKEASPRQYPRRRL